MFTVEKPVVLATVLAIYATLQTSVVVDDDDDDEAIITAVAAVTLNNFKSHIHKVQEPETE